jgi:hypothetical protein
MKRIMQRLTVAMVMVFDSGALAQASVIYVRASANGANNGTSWTDAFVSLQSARGTAKRY